MGWKTPIEFIGSKFRKMFEGVAAFIVQFYDEVNKKRGLQWEASRSVDLGSEGDLVYSLIVVGSKDVDLKARELGATGGGVIGRAYKIQPSDVDLTGGTPDPWYNYNSSVQSSGAQPETELYPGSEITFVTPVVNLAVPANKHHADIFAITNIQNQAKGFASRAFGGNHILAPGDYILLEIESFDSSQTATAKLDMYEGILDFYPD